MFDDIGFHEATVTRIDYVDGNLHLQLNGVTRPDGKKVHGMISLSQVSTIEADDVTTSKIEMEEEDGEIVYLECGEVELTTVIQWNNFTRHLAFQKHYRIKFALAEWAEDSPDNASI